MENSCVRWNMDMTVPLKLLQPPIRALHPTPGLWIRSTVRISPGSLAAMKSWRNSVLERVSKKARQLPRQIPHDLLLSRLCSAIRTSFSCLRGISLISNMMIVDWVYEES